MTLLFVWFGVFGVLGNTLASKYVDRIGADRAVGFALVLMALSLLAWPFARGVARSALVMRAVGARLLLVAVDAAGAARRGGTGARVGADGAQHLGDLPRPGRPARRAAAGSSPTTATARSAGSASPGSSLAIALSVWAGRALRRAA